VLSVCALCVYSIYYCVFDLCVCYVFARSIPSFYVVHGSFVLNRIIIQAAFSLFNLPLADIIDADLQKYKRRYMTCVHVCVCLRIHSSLKSLKECTDLFFPVEIQESFIDMLLFDMIYTVYIYTVYRMRY